MRAVPGSMNLPSRGFTLVELLVVVTIIGVLAASLTIGAKSAVEYARRTRCATNLHQLFIANAAYAAEFGCYVPAASTVWSAKDLCRWHGYRDSSKEPFRGELGPLAEYLDSNGIRACPSFHPKANGLSASENFEHGCGGYGYNQVGVGSRLYLDGMCAAAYEEGMPPDQIADAPNTAMFGDAAFLSSGRKGDTTLIEYSFIEPYHWVFAPGTESSAVSEPSVHFRHRKYANVAWCDGHVSPVKMEHVPGEKYKKAHLGWIGPKDNTLMDPN